MNMERMKRYKDKLNIISKRIDEIEQWISEFELEDFVRDEKTKLATYKAFEEIVESSMDIVAMMCKDSGIVPKDDYTNIDNLDILDNEMKEVFTEANGLRNRLVHLYNEVDDILAFESIKDLLSKQEMFIELVEQWIKARLKEG